MNEPVSNSWDWQNMPVDRSEAMGFVYKITCLANGKKYIGKKLFTKAKKQKPLKGKVRARRSRVASDWEKYFGSSKELLADLKTFGKEQFVREVLQVCASKGVLSYFELRHQMAADALFRSSFYNAIINVRLGRNVFPKHMIEEADAKEAEETRKLKASLQKDPSNDLLESAPKEIVSSNHPNNPLH